jgi:hypothetical protein
LLCTGHGIFCHSKEGDFQCDDKFSDHCHRSMFYQLLQYNLQSFIQFLHIQASQKSQISGFLISKPSVKVIWHN